MNAIKPNWITTQNNENLSYEMEKKEENLAGGFFIQFLHPLSLNLELLGNTATLGPQMPSTSSILSPRIGALRHSIIHCTRISKAVLQCQPIVTSSGKCATLGPILIFRLPVGVEYPVLTQIGWNIPMVSFAWFPI